MRERKRNLRLNANIFFYIDGTFFAAKNKVDRNPRSLYITLRKKRRRRKQYLQGRQEKPRGQSIRRV